jgi:hypothetical protein
MTDTARFAIEIFATADSLQIIAQQIDRLDRDRHPAVYGTDKAVIVYCSAATIAQALEALAQRLAQMED